MQASDVVRRIEGMLQATARVGHPPLKLQEANLGGRNSPVTIGKDHGALVVSFDQCFSARVGSGNLADWLYPLFDYSFELRCSCDYLCFQSRGDVLWVVMFELKTAHASGARHQIACTSLLARYLIATALHAMGEQTGPKVEYRGVVFNETSRAQKASYRGGVTYLRDYARAPNLAFVTLRRQSYYPLDAFLC